jgi:hypothetical protein
MIDFSKLDPETRCIALVGEFLRRWSSLEAALHDALAIAMRLDDTMRSILCANVQLRDKINILRTIVSISNLEANKSHFDKMLVAIGEYSPSRNMMAHDTFGPDDQGKGVLFLPVKAKGKFSQPKIIWTADQFSIEYHKIDDFRKQLVQLKAALNKSQFSFGNIDWTADASMPMRRTMSPALLYSLSQPTPLPLYESQAKPKKSE